MMIRKLSFLSLACLLLAASTGCASVKLKDPPPGFIEVSSSKWDGEVNLRMKAPDNVGLNIATFRNRKGGKLPLWSEDLVKKLDARHYQLVSQTAVKSANGVAGTRFDFRYLPPGTEAEEEKFYTAVLFVTDEWRVVIQLAGEVELSDEHAGDLDKVLREIKIRGCKVGKDTCKGPQPATLSTSTKIAAKPADAKADEAQDDKPASEEPADAKADEAPAEDKAAEDKPGG